MKDNNTEQIKTGRVSTINKISAWLTAWEYIIGFIGYQLAV